MKCIELSWDEVHQACLKLASKIASCRKIDLIIPVLRGGLIPATIISHELKIPIGASADMKMLCDPNERTDIAVVDDVCDTGSTFKLLRNAFPGALFAVPYAKAGGLNQCDLTVEVHAQDVWLTFPWSPNQTPGGRGI
jgi:hypoxanthine phosphoribosyltransferase